MSHREENCRRREEMRDHVLLVPFPAQGHINPILQFAKRLASKGLKTTLATTVYVSKSMHLKHCDVGIETFSDGFDQIGLKFSENGGIYFSTLAKVGTQTLADVIQKYNHENNTISEPISCLVCDVNLPWALDVGKELGLVTASFFPQSCSVSYIIYHARQGNLRIPVQEPRVSIPGLPLLALQDLPSPMVVAFEQTALEVFLSQFSNLEKADWILFNTFEKLEAEVLKQMEGLWRVGAIGPTTPSMYLDKRIEDDIENSLSLFKPSDGSYMSWLDKKGSGSVLYISFGSLAELGEEQIEELTWGIRQSNKEFIWVVRETEQSKLTEGFAEDMLDKGLVVPWCSQLEVLAHEAVGCFLTHCGWNSTLEALSLGVPMVAMPYAWDQLTNAKFIEDVWGIGIRVNKDDKGIVRREEIERCIREVMERQRGKEIKMNATLLRELAKDAISEGGSSDRNIEEFVGSITCT